MPQVESSLIYLCLDPSTEEMISKKMFWKDVPIWLRYPTRHPIGHSPVICEGEKKQTIEFASFWFAGNPDGISTHHTLWLSRNRIPGWIMIADGMFGDVVKIGSQKYNFADLWRDCVLVRPNKLKGITVTVFWDSGESKKAEEWSTAFPGNSYENEANLAPLHIQLQLQLSFHARVRLERPNLVKLTDLNNSLGEDLILTAHQKCYYTFSKENSTLPEDWQRLALTVS